MARKRSFIKKFGEVVNDLVLNLVGGEPSYRYGKPSIEISRWERLGSAGRIRAERPTRNQEEFAIIQDILTNSPAIASAIRKLSEDAALDENGDDQAWSLGLKVEIDQNAPDKDARAKRAREVRRDLQKIFSDFLRRTGLGYNTKHYISKMLSAGDCFAELGINLDTDTGLGRIESVQELPTWQMRVEIDNRMDIRAYEQWTTPNDDNPSRWNIPAQIIHWRYQMCDYMPYGQTIFNSFYGRWEAFKLMELDLLAAIHTRAVSPEIHYLGNPDSQEAPDETQRAAYERKLRDNPTDLNRFYVIPEGEVRIEFPKTQDSNAITILQSVHRDFESRFVEALGVPGLLAGNSKDIAGRHIANSIDQDYARRVASIRGDFSHFLYPALALEFALHGYDFSKPELYDAINISFYINWPDLGEGRTAKSKRTTMEWLAGKIPLEEALRQDGYQDPEGMIQLMLEERARDILPLDVLTKREQQISNNNEQGKGVPNDQSTPDEKQATTEFYKWLLGKDDDEIRTIIREEISQALNNNNE